MSERNVSLPARVGPTDTPAWLVEVADKDDSIKSLATTRVLPRVKVIQAMSDNLLKESFGEGSLVMMPASVLLARKNETFQAVPVFFFPEYIKWRDLRDKSGMAIVERSLLQSSALAARANDPVKRREQYAGGPVDKPFEYRYVEHLNFVVVVYGEHSVAGATVVLQYSRGEHGRGMALVSACQLRRVGGRIAPLWSQVWNFRGGFRDKGEQRRWYGIDHSMPDNPWIKQEEVQSFRETYESIAKSYKEGLLGVVEDETEVRETAAEGVELEM